MPIVWSILGSRFARMKEDSRQEEVGAGGASLYAKSRAFDGFRDGKQCKSVSGAGLSQFEQAEWLCAHLVYETAVWQGSLTAGTYRHAWTPPKGLGVPCLHKGEVSGRLHRRQKIKAGQKSCRLRQGRWSVRFTLSASFHLGLFVTSSSRTFFIKC